MSQKIRIKDIARLAGVSAGTVDRVLHNRGNVSESKLKAIEKVLRQVDYNPNIHLSAISLKKKYRLAVTMPAYDDGDFWHAVHRGIIYAQKEYGNIDIELSFYLYDQFDLFHCNVVREELMKADVDGIIIGPTFIEGTRLLAEAMESRGIPYVYVDSVVEDTSPLTYFVSDQHRCGYLLAKLLTATTRPGSEYVLFQAIRKGDAVSNNTMLRRSGFMDYCKDHGVEGKVHTIPYSVMNPAENKEHMGDFFVKNPAVKGVAVLGTRVHIIADLFNREKMRGIRLVGMDLTKGNTAAMRKGDINFLVGQRPEKQGFLAVESLLHHMLYGKTAFKDNFQPLDIITLENLDYWDAERRADTLGLPLMPV